MKKTLFILLLLFFLTLLPGGEVYAEKLTLSRCYELARLRNYDYRDKELDYEIGVIEEKRARARFYPTISTSTTFKSSAKLDYPLDQANSNSIDMNQPIYYSGEITNTFKSKEAAKNARMLNVMSQDLILRRDVFIAYVSVIKYQRLLQIKENAIRKVKNQLQYIEKIVAEKKRGSESINRWKVLLNEFENEYLTAMNALEDSQIQLNTLIVRDLSEKADLYSMGSEAFFNDLHKEKETQVNYSFNEMVDILYNYALIYNPGVHLKEEIIKETLYDFKAEKSGNLPKVDLVPGYGGGSNTIPSWNIGLKVSFTVLNINDWGNVIVKEKRLEKTKNDQKKYLQSLKSSIRSTYSAKITALKETRNRVMQSEEAHDYLNQMIINYNEGTSTDIDLIDAFKTYYENQSGMLTSIYNYFIQQEILETLLGITNYRQTPSIEEFIKTKDKSKFHMERVIDEGGAFYSAINQQDFEQVKEILEKDPGLINQLSPVGWAPIHWASYRGNREILEYLIEKGADVNIRSSRGFTPLFIAVDSDNQEAVEILLKNSSNPNIACGKYKWTPLIRATELNSEKNIELLLKGGADPNSPSVNNWTALHTAADVGSIKIVEMLLNSGAKVVIKNRLGKTPLDIAVIYGRDEIVKLLKGTKEIENNGYENETINIEEKSK